MTEVSNLEERGVNLLMMPVEQADQLNLQPKKLIEEILTGDSRKEVLPPLSTYAPTE